MHFERLLAITNPELLAQSEATALLLDSTAHKNGHISFEAILDLVKKQEDMTISSTLKKTLTQVSGTVEEVLEEVRQTLTEFWGASLGKTQHSQFEAFIENLLLDLKTQEDFPWIEWDKKGKKNTAFQYNLFLASDPEGGNMFFYNLPVLIKINVKMPFEKLVDLKKTDEIDLDIRIEGLKIAQLTSYDIIPRSYRPEAEPNGDVLPGIIVSAHGGRWTNQKENLEVPSKSTLIYYVPDGGTLSDPDGEEILYALKKGEKPKVPVAQTVTAGHDTYNYECWYASDWAKDCGIFEVGTGRLLMSLEKYTEKNPLSLKTILEKFPGCAVYWDGCRSVSDPNRFAYHPIPKGSYLAVPKREVSLVEKITQVRVTSLAGTLVLTGPNGEYDSEKPVLWVNQEQSQTHNGGPVEKQQYTVSFTGTGSPVTMTFKGRFAGVGYEFV